MIWIVTIVVFLISHCSYVNWNTAETVQQNDPLAITDLSVTYIADIEEIAISACTKGHSGTGITLRISTIQTPTEDVESGHWTILNELGVPCFGDLDRPIISVKDWESGTYVLLLEAKVTPRWDSPTTQRSVILYQVP